jgi:hypothetical protein
MSTPAMGGPGFSASGQFPRYDLHGKRALISDITQDAINLPDYNRITVNQPLTAGIDLNIKY